MQVRCVQPFGRHALGDVAEVPDGAEVSPVYYEPLHSGGTPPPDRDPGGTPPPGDPPPPETSPVGAFSQPKDN